MSNSLTTNTRYNRELTKKYILPALKSKSGPEYMNELVKDEYAYTQPKKGGRLSKKNVFDIAETTIPPLIASVDPVLGPAVVSPLSSVAIKKLRKMLGGKITSKAVIGHVLDALPYALSLVPAVLAPEFAPVLAPLTMAASKKGRQLVKDKTGYGTNPFVERFVNQVGYFPDDMVRPQTREKILKGKGKKSDTKLLNDIVDMAIGSIQRKRGGALPSFEQLKDQLKPVAKMILKEGAKHLIPYVAEQVGQHFGNAPLGKQVGKIISEFLEEKLEGLGRSGGKRKKRGGCNGEPCGECEVDIEYKGGRVRKQKPIRITKDKPVRPMTERKRRRNELIKKLMGNGMQFLDASKEATKLMRENKK